MKVFHIDFLPEILKKRFVLPKILILKIAFIFYIIVYHILNIINELLTIFMIF